MKYIKRIFILLIVFMLASIGIYSKTNKDISNVYAEEDKYLTFTAKEGSASIAFNFENLESIQFKINDGSWTDYTLANTNQQGSIDLNENDYVKFKANGMKTNATYLQFTMNSNDDGVIEGSGDITSLLNGIGGDYDLSVFESSVQPFAHMFGMCSIMTKAPNLPSTTLGNSCYYGTFYGCSSLLETPVLPATNLASYCYWGMFGECTSLTSLPNLPATNLADCCYDSMFILCTSIKMSETKGGHYTKPWSISSNTIAADWWYNEMFTECGSTNCCDTSNSGKNVEIGKTYYLYVDGYSVTYDDNVDNEDITMPTDDNLYQTDDLATISTTTPSRTGYKFKGWNTDKSATSGLTFTNGTIKIENTSITLYAIWQEIPHEHGTSGNDDYILFNNKLDSSFTGGALTSGNYYLVEDITLTQAITVASDQTINLCLNDKVLNLNNFNIQNSGTLTIDDCGTTKHYFTIDETTKLWTITSSETENYVEGGVITGGYGVQPTYITNLKNRIYGGAIFNLPDATLTLNNGNIVGNRAKYGAGITNHGFFTMNGGNIIGNYSLTSGAGIQNGYGDYVGSFTLNGGIISQNNSGYGGGGVTTTQYSIFTMNGGSIIKNTASNQAAGLMCNSETYLLGGEISNNTITNSTGTYSSSYLIDDAYCAAGIMYYNYYGNNKLILGGDIVINNNLTNGLQDNLVIVDYSLDDYDLNSDFTLLISTDLPLLDGAYIGIKLERNTGTFISEFSDSSYVKYFHSDDTDYGIKTIEIKDSNPKSYNYTVEEVYTVTYDGNGSTSGSAPTDPNSYFVGDSITFLSNTNSLAKEGYTLVGWNTDSNATTALTSYTMTANNVTLYAIWEENYYDGSISVTTTNDFEFNYGVTASDIKDALSVTEEDFSIDGVCIYQVNNGTIVSSISTNTTYKILIGVTRTDGKWLKNTTNYIYDGTITVNGVTSEYNKCGDIINYSNGVIGMSKSSKYVCTKILLSYQVTVSGYNVTYNDNCDYEVITVPTDTSKYIKGQSVSVDTTTLSRTGFTFVGWNSDKDATTAMTLTDGKFTMSNSNVTLYAIWKANEHSCHDITYNQPINNSNIRDYLTYTSGHYYFNEGNYYLAEDITINLGGIYIANNTSVKLCLNDHKLTLNGDTYFYIKESSLYIYDCGDTTRYYKEDSNNYGAWIEDSEGTYTTKGGVITCTNTANYGYMGKLTNITDGKLYLDGVNLVGFKVSSNNDLIGVYEASSYGDTIVSIKNSNIKGNTYSTEAANSSGILNQGSNTQIELDNTTISNNYSIRLIEFTAGYSKTLKIGNNVVIINNYNAYGSNLTVGIVLDGNKTIGLLNDNPTGNNIEISVRNRWINYQIVESTSKDISGQFTISTYSDSIKNSNYNYTLASEGYVIRSMYNDSLYSTCLSKQIRVTYATLKDLDDGYSLPVDENIYLYGDTVTIASSSNLVVSGYKFNYWADGTNTTYANTFTITNDITLYAHYYSRAISFDFDYGKFYYDNTTIECEEISDDMYSYDEETNTLTLNNFVYDSEIESALYFGQYINIVIKGTCSITSSVRGIEFFKGATINGSGILNITGQLYETGGDTTGLTIDGPTINVTSNSANASIIASMGFVVKDGKITSTCLSDSGMAFYGGSNNDAVFKWGNPLSINKLLSYQYGVATVEADSNDNSVFIPVTYCEIYPNKIIAQPNVDNDFKFETSYEEDSTYQWYRKEIEKKPQTTLDDFDFSMFGNPFTLNSETNELSATFNTSVYIFLTDETYSSYKAITFTSTTLLIVDSSFDNTLTYTYDEQTGLYTYIVNINNPYKEGGYVFNVCVIYNPDTSNSEATINNVEIINLYKSIEGANKSTYTPSESGEYYCIQTVGDSTKTSNTIIASTILFNGNSGEGNVDSITKYNGQQLVFPTTGLTKTNYNLLGWNTTSDAISALSSYTFGEDDATLYAIWSNKTSISLTLDPQSYVYDGGSIEFELKGTHKDIGSYSIEYKVNNEWSITAPIDVGNYDVRISRNEDSTYASFTTTITSGLVISQKEVVISWCEDDFTYNASKQTITATYKDANDNDVALSVTISKDFINAGVYLATASFANNETNYKLPSTITKEYTMKSKSVEITNKEVEEDKKAEEGSSVTIIEGSLGVTIKAVIQKDSTKYAKEVLNNIKEATQSKKSSIIAEFEIHLEDQDGVKVENIDGNRYQVTLTIPSKLQGKTGYAVLCINDDGTVEKYDTSSTETSLTFETTHFSNWVIVADKSFAWWWILIIFFILLVIAAALYFLYTRSEKIREFIEDRFDR